MDKTTTKKNAGNKSKENKVKNNNSEEHFLPSHSVINNILNYSKALKITKSKSDNSYVTLLN